MTTPTSDVGTEPAVASTAPPDATGRLIDRLRWADLALVLVVAGTAIRVWRWWFGHPLWLDEQMIAINVRDTGFVTLTGRLLHSQSAPLGWLWAERVTVLILGTGERAVRFVPLVFAVATLVVAWLGARRWLGPVGAVTLTALLAAAPALVRYSTEVKQYSSDAFWVLVLVLLAAWVLERPAPLRPMGAWWLTAAVASWFSMAAIFVVPSLAVVLVVVMMRRYGRRTALRAALFGVTWLAASGVHYLISLRYTTGQAYLKDFWAGRGGLPPAGGGAVERGQWLVDRLPGLATDPLFLFGVAVTGFWCLVAAGVVVAGWRKGAAGWLLAGPIATGAALGLAGVVPLVSRLALWLVPVLFLAVAVACDALARSAVQLARSPGAARRLAAAGVAALATVILAGGLGVVRTQLAGDARPPVNNDGTDDRAAIAWLKARHRAGDLTVVWVGSTPAARWYAPGGQLRPGWYARGVEPGPQCPTGRFRAALRGHQRVLGYSIRAPLGLLTHLALEAELSTLGRRVDGQEFNLGRVWIVELDQATLAADPAPADPALVGAGCLQLNPI